MPKDARKNARKNARKKEPTTELPSIQSGPSVSEVAASWVKQVGEYGTTEDRVKTLDTKADTTSGENPLYLGKNAYANDYAEKVNRYLRANPDNTYDTGAIENRRFFRELFLQRLAKVALDETKNASRQKEKYKETDPKKAAISMDELLGPEDTKLYQLALEEEMQSKEFMDAVLDQSTAQLPGENLAKRPMIFVGGPSGSGKSTAAADAIQEASKYLEKAKEGQEGVSRIISVDGGKAREVSQMRKILLNVAIGKGYSGISDLQKKSEILRKVKRRIYEFAMHRTNAGLIIPETFSNYITNIVPHPIVEEVSKRTDATVIFTRVVGQDPKTFKGVVSHMGNDRAWKREKQEKMTTPEQFQKLSLNEKPAPESKAYGKRGYGMGAKGSKNAENWFASKKPGNLRMIITNDLVLKRQRKSGRWVDAKPGQKGVIKVSKRVFDKWKKSDKTVGLIEFMKKPENKVSSIIQTPAQFQANSVIKQLEIYSRKNKKDDEINQLVPKFVSLVKNNFYDKEAVKEVKRAIDDYIKQHKTEDLKELKNASEILNIRLKELSPEQPRELKRGFGRLRIFSQRKLEPVIKPANDFEMQTISDTTKQSQWTRSEAPPKPEKSTTQTKNQASGWKSALPSRDVITRFFNARNDRTISDTNLSETTTATNIGEKKKEIKSETEEIASPPIATVAQVQPEVSNIPTPPTPPPMNGSGQAVELAVTTGVNEKNEKDKPISIITAAAEVQPDTKKETEVKHIDYTTMEQINTFKDKLKDWQFNKNESERGAVSYTVTKDESKFTIHKHAFRTEDSNHDTFAAMLQSFKAVRGAEAMPQITIDKDEDQQIRQKWERALQEVYPGKKFDLEKVIKVKETAPAPAPVTERMSMNMS